MADQKLTEVQIFPEDPQAATFQNGLSGWVSRDGMCHGKDERQARWAGSTHRKCEKCGYVCERNSYCKPCSIAREETKFKNMDSAKWDGVAMIYSLTLDEYFQDMSAVEDWISDSDEEGCSYASLKLVLCEPKYATIDLDYFSDDLHEDTDSSELDSAIDVFNESMKGIALSWEPGKFKLDIEGLQ